MQYIRRFNELGVGDVGLVGGKNASLGELYRNLAAEGVKVHKGFDTTAAAYRHYLAHNHHDQRIHDALNELDIHDVRALAVAGAKIRQWIMRGDIPDDLAAEIRAGYKALAAEYGASPDVAVRSSATAEDLPTASFAGQQETYLNIRGTDNLLATCKRVFASLFMDRAISYRVDQGFDHMSVALSIGLQKMVRAALGAAGVMFTLDTETGFRGVVFINAAYGLGENVVQGSVNPDEFYVFKTTLASGHRPILNRQLGSKERKLVYAADAIAGVSTRNIPVKKEERDRFALTDDEVLQLARYATVIEQHYSKQAGRPMPMDIEWAKDGVSNKLFILQARPETVHAAKSSHALETYRLEQRGPLLATGKSVGQKIAAGTARVILEAKDMGELEPGEVLITDITDPDWEPVMKIAAAIVTNRGGRTCHAAIVARELGIPAVVGCGDATQRIASGAAVTVSCAEGDAGHIYAGTLRFRKDTANLSALPRPDTHIMINVGNPQTAFEVCQLPNDGVGLARLEFIINNSIRNHPRALIGGEAYEPKEENPMIGFRGASRYPAERFAECFAMECAAMKQVREELGLTNVALMIPFVRSVDEARQVLDLMTHHGLQRGEHDLKIFMMCEIPANALLADEFLDLFDGFSIGSNDLTQLTLGVDRDSGIVTGFDERNGAVLKLMEMAIKACKARGKYIGICGQAPSDYPEITQWLVSKGSESISLNADSVLTMLPQVMAAERQLGNEALP